MLFAIAFVILFTIGGFSGLMLSIVPAFFQYHDTYFVVAPSIARASSRLDLRLWRRLTMAPKWTGNMYDETLGKALLVVIYRSQCDVLPAAFHWPCRHATSLPRLCTPVCRLEHGLEWAPTFWFQPVLFLFIVVKTIRGGKKASDEVWDGAEGLEWTIPSPAPYRTFSTPLTCASTLSEGRAR